MWGGPRREYAAIKFFLYTLLGSVLMLVVLLAFYFKSAEATAVMTASELSTLAYDDLKLEDGRVELQPMEGLEPIRLPFAR